MQALEQKLDALQKDDILVLAGSIPASLAQTTYERLLARLEFEIKENFQIAGFVFLLVLKILI